MSKPLVTILLPNYKTAVLTKLCLRLLKKYTDLKLATVIVIDNDSQDDSLDYLRSLSWITLIERKADVCEAPAQAHAKALDLALDQVETRYVLSIHTDTLVKRPDWLSFLLSHLEKNPNAAGVGSWKLESKPFWRNFLKKLERAWQFFYLRLNKKTQSMIEGVGENYFYLRSHCALYRNDLLKKYNLHFADADQVAGKFLHQALVQAGHEMIFLPSDVLIPYLDHINHATMVLNPNLGSREKTIVQGLKRIQKKLQKINAENILRDESLDH